MSMSIFNHFVKVKLLAILIIPVNHMIIYKFYVIEFIRLVTFSRKYLTLCYRLFFIHLVYYLLTGVDCLDTNYQLSLSYFGVNLAKI